MRVETIGDCVLYEGDCLSILPTLGPVDAVVTDPPYGVDGGRGGDARDFAKAAYHAPWKDDEHYIVAVCVPATQICLRLAKRGAITPGVRHIQLYPKAADIGCFWTPATATHGPWGFTTFQPILYYGQDFRAGRGALPTGRQLTEIAEKNGHPCPKPLLAWRWLVDKASLPSESVLDPFMGSGTTGVACVNLGRRFIGIEIEPSYFDIACKRIEDAYKHPHVDAPRWQAPKLSEPQWRVVRDIVGRTTLAGKDEAIRQRVVKVIDATSSNVVRSVAGEGT